MHPKYTLVFRYNEYFQYTIMEHISTEGGGIMSREFGRYPNYEEAMRRLSELSNGPVLIASSNQPIDNIFEV